MEAWRARGAGIGLTCLSLPLVVAGVALMHGDAGTAPLMGASVSLASVGLPALGTLVLTAGIGTMIAATILIAMGATARRPPAPEPREL